MKPRVLILCQHFGIPEHQTKLRALSRHWEITAVTAKKTSAFGWSEMANSHPINDSLGLIVLDNWGSLKTGTKFVFWGLTNIIRSSRYDVILVESEPWSFLRWQTWILKRIFSPQSLFGEFTWENIHRIGYKGRLLRLIYRWAALTTDFVIAGNIDAKHFFAQAGLWKKKILVAPQIGVDPSLYFPVSLETRLALRKQQSLPNEARIIGFVGRFLEEKGIIDLILATQSAREIDSSIELAILGSGPLEDQIRSFMNQYPWIHLMPPRAQNDVPRFLQSLDLLVLPSKKIQNHKKTWKEQFGHVLIEAMACGIPVMGSDSGAIPEVIQNPSFIFKEGNITELHNLILRYFRSSDPLFISMNQKSCLALVNQYYSHASVAHSYDRFIKNRLKNEKKRILWIDPILCSESPTTKPLFESIPYLLFKQWEIAFLGFQSKANCNDIDPHIVHCPKKLRLIFLYLSPLIFHITILFHRIIKGRPLASIVHVTHGTYFFSDISIIQFWNTAWFKMQIKMRWFHFRFLKQLVPTVLSSLFENTHRLLRPQGLFLTASRGIRDSIHARLSLSPAYRVFPNAYDSKRFNIEVRIQHRDKTRAELCFQSHEQVFLFASQGHYERKGFWRAFHALKLLKTKNIPLRFLIVGGTHNRLNDLKSELLKHDPNFETWISFTGTTEQTEKYFSAADAFLFPSYFEAFCLAEIECAALGIPLLLTPHPGVEMILCPGKNGLLLPEKPEEIANIIENDFLKRSDPWIYNTGEAVTQEQYSHNLNALYEEVLKNKYKP